MGDLRSVSYGAGVQSTALLVLAARRVIDFPLFIFANTGEDSEHPDTLDYFVHVARPYAKHHGIELVEVRADRTLWTAAMGRDGRSSMPLPFRGEKGNPLSRACTVSWKIRPIGAELRRRGASKDEPAIMALGISTDEIQRAKLPGEVNPQMPTQIRVYPLIDLGMNRNDCETLIRDEGLPIPAPSACYFCPFHTRNEWQHLRATRPDLFDRACELEVQYKARAREYGQRDVWITDAGARSHRLLSEVIHDQGQFPFEPGEECEGVCFT